MLLAAQGGVDPNPAHPHKLSIFCWGSNGIRKGYSKLWSPPAGHRFHRLLRMAPRPWAHHAWARPSSSSGALCMCLRFGSSSQGQTLFSAKGGPPCAKKQHWVRADAVTAPKNLAGIFSGHLENKPCLSIHPLPHTHTSQPSEP